MDKEMVLVRNTNSTGLNSIEKEPDVLIPRDILTQIQDWVVKREFDDEDMVDIYRKESFSDYKIIREHFHGHEDHVTLIHNNKLASLKLSDFIDI